MPPSSQQPPLPQHTPPHSRPFPATPCPGFQVLLPREQLVLRLRYGLDGGGHRSVRDVAELMNLNRNTVTGLCKLAFQKVRAVPGAESLLECLTEA